MLKGLALFTLMLFLLSGCSEREGLAPVFESKWYNPNVQRSKHKVVKGETLYAIAFRYDKDYRQLARVNHLSAPYALQAGQKIFLYSSVTGSSNKGLKSNSVRTIRKKEKPVTHFDGRWIWPATGKVVAKYSPRQGKKGINISGKRGEDIVAASGGVVAYAGDGLPGYGNLIIIKHNKKYLTAYGNNLKNLVKEGQSVKKGQIIAKMGRVDRKYWGLHFEIRKEGKPVNPLQYVSRA